MIHRALVMVALACSVVLLASFALFARGQIAGAATIQANEVAGQTLNPAPPAPKQEGQPRRFIDGAASALTSPFHSVVSSTSAWVEHGVPTVLALLVYGVGLGFLARFSRGFA